MYDVLTDSVIDYPDDTSGSNSCVCIENITITAHYVLRWCLKARVRRTSAFRAPDGKPSDVRQIMSSHEGSFVFIIHPN